MLLGLVVFAGLDNLPVVAAPVFLRERERDFFNFYSSGYFALCVSVRESE